MDVNSDLGWLGAVQLVGVIYNTFFSYFSVSAFLVFYLRDLKLKHFMQLQCRYMIDIKKSETAKQKKLFPNIDITSPFAYKAWSILRQVCMDYGVSYNLRMEVFFTINLLVFLVTFVVFSLWFYEIYDFPTEYIIVSIWEILFLLTILSQILYRGSRINNLFHKFQDHLGDCRVFTLDMMRMKNTYFTFRQRQSGIVIRKAVKKILELFLKTAKNNPTYRDIFENLDLQQL